jgi:hypothetical protein
LEARVIREPSLIAIIIGEVLATTRSPSINGQEAIPAVLTKLPSSSKEDEPETVATGWLANAPKPPTTTAIQIPRVRFI